MSTLFGLNECTELVHVSEVARGLACQCRCVGCGEPLVARQGAVRDHHFAHASNLEACESSFESLLHRYAKQLVVQARGLVAPVTPPVAAILGWDANASQQLLHAFGEVQEEVSVGAIRPDLLVTTDDGVIVAIEIAHSSFCDIDKARQFEELGLPALEIDLSGFTPEGFDPVAVRHAVINALDHKRWVWPCEASQTEEPVIPPSPDPAPQLPAAEKAQAMHLPEEIISFDGRWVSIKQFPSGDIAVKVVAWDPDLVSLVKSVAKAHGGRYNAHYKTWNVPRWAAHTVRANLRNKSKTLGIYAVLNEKASEH